MNTEQKAKAYDEALERAKEWATEREQLICPREIVESIFPQLRESEDEKMRKLIMNRIRSATEMTEGLRELLLTYLEKQKELDKMIVVSPEVWDNAISDAFENGKKEGEKQKEQNGEDEECTDFTIYHPLKNGKGKYECIPYSFYGSLTSFSEDKDLIDFLRTCFYTEEECNEWIEQQAEQRPVAHENDFVSKPMNQDELEKELDRYLRGEFQQTAGGNFNNYIQVARHFYELGCTRTAEKYDEIEYNRQRAEEQGREGLEEEIKRYLREECSDDDEPGIHELAEHFAKWGAEHLKK